MSIESRLACNLALVKAGVCIWAKAAVSNSLSAIKRKLMNAPASWFGLLPAAMFLWQTAVCVTGMMLLFSMILEALYLPGVISMLVAGAVHLQDVSLLFFRADIKVMPTVIHGSLMFYTWVIAVGGIGLCLYLSLKNFCMLGKASLAGSGVVGDAGGDQK